jgi:hypothetical protein
VRCDAFLANQREIPLVLETLSPPEGRDGPPPGAPSRPRAEDRTPVQRDSPAVLFLPSLCFSRMVAGFLGIRGCGERNWGSLVSIYLRAERMLASSSQKTRGGVVAVTAAFPSRFGEQRELTRMAHRGGHRCRSQLRESDSRGHHTSEWWVRGKADTHGPPVGTNLDIGLRGVVCWWAEFIGEAQPTFSSVFFIISVLFPNSRFKLNSNCGFQFSVLQIYNRILI